MSIEERLVKSFAVRCDALWEAGPRGCSGRGRWFGSIEEAYDWAREMGWGAEPPFICPAHVESKIETMKRD